MVVYYKLGNYDENQKDTSNFGRLERAHELASLAGHTVQISKEYPARERRRAESCHRCGPKTVLAQTAEITKCHVIFIVFLKF